MLFPLICIYFRDSEIKSWLWQILSNQDSLIVYPRPFALCPDKVKGQSALEQITAGPTSWAGRSPKGLPAHVAEPAGVCSTVLGQLQEMCTPSAYSLKEYKCQCQADEHMIEVLCVRVRVSRSAR